MRKLTRASLIALSFAIFACGPKQEPTNEAGKVTLSGNLIDALSSAPLANTEVCVYERTDIPCVTSDPLGNFSLPGVPASSEIMLSFFKTGYYAHVAMMNTLAGNEEFEYKLLSETGMTLMTATVNQELDLQKAQIIFGAGSSRGEDSVSVSGVSAALTPVSGAGPYYNGSSGLDDTMTATGEKGNGGILNLEPGDYEITFTHETKTCSLGRFAWPGSAENKARVKAVGTQSVYVNTICN